VAFDTLKDIIIIVPVLIFPDISVFFHIEANSLNLTTGAILFQALKEDGK